MYTPHIKMDKQNHHHSDEDSLLDDHELQLDYAASHRERVRQSRWPKPSTMFSAATACLSLLAVCLLIIVFQRQYRNNHHGKVGLNDTITDMQWKDCGNSSTEARAKGCVFDVLLTTWIHADCFDAELHEQYLTEHTFPFWRKPTLEESISLDEVRRGDYYEIYTNLDYHFVHCGYAWVYILRKYRRAEAIEGELWRMSHTLHCVHHLVDRPPMELDRTVLNIGFETCGKPYY